MSLSLFLSVPQFSHSFLPSLSSPSPSVSPCSYPYPFTTKLLGLWFLHLLASLRVPVWVLPLVFCGSHPKGSPHPCWPVPVGTMPNSCLIHEFLPFSFDNPGIFPYSQPLPLCLYNGLQRNAMLGILLQPWLCLPLCLPSFPLLLWASRVCPCLRPLFFFSPPLFAIVSLLLRTMPVGAMERWGPWASEGWVLCRKKSASQRKMMV